MKKQEIRNKNTTSVTVTFQVSLKLALSKRSQKLIENLLN